MMGEFLLKLPIDMSEGVIVAILVKVVGVALKYDILFRDDSGPPQRMQGDIKDGEINLTPEEARLAQGKRLVLQNNRGEILNQKVVLEPGSELQLSEATSRLSLQYRCPVVSSKLIPSCYLAYFMRTCAFLKVKCDYRSDPSRQVKMIYGPSNWQELRLNDRTQLSWWKQNIEAANGFEVKLA